MICKEYPKEYATSHNLMNSQPNARIVYKDTLNAILGEIFLIFISSLLKILNFFLAIFWKKWINLSEKRYITPRKIRRNNVNSNII